MDICTTIIIIIITIIVYTEYNGRIMGTFHREIRISWVYKGEIVGHNGDMRIWK